MEKAKILIVEDERIIAMDIKNSLQKMGYCVCGIAHSGEMAIQRTAELQPDLVLMDIILKGEMDGVEAAETIYHSYNIPIIYLTAHSDVPTLKRAKATEPFGYLIKPFEERDLQTAIEIALVRAQAEADIRKALAKEKELNELKSRFISIVSHEFRTPLSTILFSSSLLENYSGKWTEERRLTHIHRIQTAVHQMTHLLEDVLSVGRAEANKLEFNPVLVNLENFCKEIVEEVRLTIGHQYKIELIMNQNKPAALAEEQTLNRGIYLDEKLMRQVLINLLSNAIKYSQSGSKIEVEVTCLEEQVCFRIQDWGMGIPQEDQQHLFEMFHRAKNVGTIPGTGLGLAIVKRSVEVHGGEITIDSQVEVGTTIRVTLPILKNPEAVAASPL